MLSDRRESKDQSNGWCLEQMRSVRPLSLLLMTLLAVTQIPVVSAHGSTETSVLTQWHGLALVFAGISFVGGVVLFKRRSHISPTTALYAVSVGITVTAFGAILFEGLSPDPVYGASTMPFPRSWYQPIALGTGFLIMGLSFLIGRLRWPNRPRYTFLGMLLGAWISYPYLIPGTASDTHPLGYAIVLGTPVLVGYIIWKDAGSVLRAVYRDRVARGFGIGITILTAIFFATVTSYLTFLPQEGAGIPHETTITVQSVSYQLVMWPTLEVYLPHIPLFTAASPGMILVVGMLSVLIGLNAMLIARHWRIEEQAGMTETTAGSAAVIGSCTCGCCGPLVAKIAVLAAGPSIAAPLYWVFVDTASPLGALFIVASTVLFVGTLIYSVETARRPDHDQSTSIRPAD